MQDVSRVTGNPQPLKIRGEEIVITEASIEAFGRLQAEALRAKRRAIVQPIADLEGILPPDVFQVRLDEKIAEAAQVAFLSDVEFEAWSKSAEGAVTFIWILLSLQYPDRKYTRAEVDKAVFEQMQSGAGDLNGMVNTLSGADPAGNETGPAKA